MNLYKICAVCAILATLASGTDIAVPSPEVMLREADAVMVGSLVKKGDGWTFKTGQVLKGRWKPGEVISVTSPFWEEAFSFQWLSKLVGKGEFLFVGRFDQETSSLQPIFGLCSAWPQGTVKDLLPLRTLPECVAFAEEVLAGTGKPDKE